MKNTTCLSRYKKLTDLTKLPRETAGVAQLVERGTENPGVPSSILGPGTSMARNDYYPGGSLRLFDMRRAGWQSSPHGGDCSLSPGPPVKLSAIPRPQSISECALTWAKLFLAEINGE